MKQLAHHLQILLYTTCCVLLVHSSVFSQSLDQLDTKNPLQINGNISTGLSFYRALNRENRRSPLSYYINASPVFKIYGFDIPIHLEYRDQQGSISNPFNRFSINPSYKWVQLYFGKNTLSLNPYVFSGQLIDGYGIALTPKNFSLTTFVGSIENPLAQIDTLVEGGLILPNYKRETQLIQLAYGGTNNFIELIGFRAKDDIGSLEFNEYPGLVKPEENLALGSSFKISPFSFFSLSANLAASALTSNQNSSVELITESSEQVLQDINENFTLNLSSKLQFAGDASADLNFRRFGIGANYKRVDPFFKSLGTLYFLEDYENFTLKLNFNLFKNKFRFTGQGGVQRNDLNNLRDNKRQRNILNMTFNLNPTRNFGTTFRWSNFQSERANINTVNDTLRYTQTNTMYVIIPRLSLGRGDKRSVITLSMNYQEMIDINRQSDTDRQIDNYTGSLNYSLLMKSSNLNIGITALANQNHIADNIRERFGGTLNIRKKLFDKKVRLNTAVGFTSNRINKVDDGYSLTGKIGLNYIQKNRYNFGLNLNFLNRDRIVDSYSEIRGTTRFTYLFTTHRKQKNNANN